MGWDVREERIKGLLRKKERICWIGIGAGKVMGVAGGVSITPGLVMRL